MRRVLHGDVTSLARVLLRVPPGRRAALCARVLQEADWADRHVRRLGRVHPLWGDGTLMSAARKRALADEPELSDPAYCSCLELVFATLARWRAEAPSGGQGAHPRAQSTQTRAVGSNRSRPGAMSSPQSSQ